MKFLATALLSIFAFASISAAQDWRPCLFVLKCPSFGTDVPRKLVKYEVPDYPQLAMAAKAEGEVKLEVTVDGTGNVVSAVPTSGIPVLRRAAWEAARKWRFDPGEPAKIEISIVFNVGSKTRARLKKPYRLEYTIKNPKVLNTIDYDSGKLSLSRSLRASSRSCFS